MDNLGITALLRRGVKCMIVCSAASAGPDDTWERYATGDACHMAVLVQCELYCGIVHLQHLPEAGRLLCCTRTDNLSDCANGVSTCMSCSCRLLLNRVAVFALTSFAVLYGALLCYAVSCGAESCDVACWFGAARTCLIPGIPAAQFNDNNHVFGASRREGEQLFQVGVCLNCCAVWVSQCRHVLYLQFIKVNCSIWSRTCTSNLHASYT